MSAIEFFKNLVTYRQKSAATEILEEGREIPDDTPLSLPVGFKRPETLAEQVARLVRRDLYDRMQNGEDVPDDEEDFDDAEDGPWSPYELVFDPVLGRDVTAKEFLNNQDRYRLKYAQATLEAHPDEDARGVPAPKRSRNAAPPKAGGVKATRQAEPDNDIDGEDV